ncbi:MAG: hypothetical protein OXN90_02285 [Gemmatimonadota bacterium]|nr:hypothetical protein [Gemmatimonadota bacterium]
MLGGDLWPASVGGHRRPRRSAPAFWPSGIGGDLRALPLAALGAAA